MKTSNASKPQTHGRGVGVYIFSDDGSKILLTQRGPAARHEPYAWEGPGGAVEPDESFEQAAHREIMEEMGIHIELGPVIGEFETVLDKNGDTWEAKIFKASTRETPSIQEPKKCTGFGWFTKEEAQKLSLASYAVKDLEAFGWL